MKLVLFLYAGLCCAEQAAKSHPPAKPAPEPITSDAVNNGSLTADVTPDSSGPAVLRAQILLDRAHFSPGEIDGLFGLNLQRAVAAYRLANGLTANANIDGEMWAKLNEDHAPAIQEYVLAAEDVAGPYTPKIPKDMMEKAKLPGLNFETPLEGLGEKFHSDPRLLQTLNAGKDFSKEGEKIMAPNVIVSVPSATVAHVLVSKNRGVVQALDDAGKVIVSYPATMGSEHDPLPIGDWQVAYISKYPHFHYNAELFWDAKNKDEKATLKPGPNSPVGIVWIGLTKEHYGIHGTESPHTIGHSQSHGCIRLTNWDAMELAGMVAKGIPVNLQEE